MRQSILYVLLGIGLVLVAMPLISVNEHRTMATDQVRSDFAMGVAAVPLSPIVKTNEGRLVYLTGDLAVPGPLIDPIFEVAESGLSMKRHVNMLQWREKETKAQDKAWGGHAITSFSYEKIWSEERIDSRKFQFQGGTVYENPRTIPFQSQVFLAKEIKLGDFVVDPLLLKPYLEAQDVSLEKVDVIALKAKLDYPVAKLNNKLFIGGDAETPAIGDMRIHFTAVYPVKVSVLARQVEGKLLPAITEDGRRISVVALGEKSMDELIGQRTQQSRSVTWLLRLLSLGLLIGGVALIAIHWPALKVPRLTYPPLSTLALVYVSGTVGVVLMLIISGWVRFTVHPFLSILTFLIAIAIAGIAFKLIQAKPIRQKLDNSQ